MQKPPICAVPFLVAACGLAPFLPAQTLSVEPVEIVDDVVINRYAPLTSGDGEEVDFVVEDPFTHLAIDVSAVSGKYVFLFATGAMDGGVSNAFGVVNPGVVSQSWTAAELHAALHPSMGVANRAGPTAEEVVIAPSRIRAFFDWVTDPAGIGLAAAGTPSGRLQMISTSTSLVDERNSWSAASFSTALNGQGLDEEFADADSLLLTSAEQAARSAPFSQPVGVAAVAQVVGDSINGEMAFQVLVYDPNAAAGDKITIKRRVKLRRRSPSSKLQAWQKNSTPLLSFPSSSGALVNVVVPGYQSAFQFDQPQAGLRAVYLDANNEYLEIEAQLNGASTLPKFDVPEDLSPFIGVVYFIDSDDKPVTPISPWLGGAAVLQWY